MTTPTESKPIQVGEQSFDNWDDALRHAFILKATGKISHGEYIELLTASKEGGGY